MSQTLNEPTVTYILQSPEAKIFWGVVGALCPGAIIYRMITAYDSVHVPSMVFLLIIASIPFLAYLYFVINAKSINHKAEFKFNVIYKKHVMLQKSEDMASLINIVREYKIVSNNDHSPVSQIDIIRYVRLAIEECKFFYVGDKSSLSKLIAKAEAYQSELSKNKGELSARIEHYSEQQSEPPRDIMLALEEVDMTLTAVSIASSELNEQMNKLKGFFDVFDGYVRELTSTEQDIELLKRVRKNLNSAGGFLDELPQKTSEAFMQVRSSMSELVGQVQNMLDELTIERAIQQPTPEDLESLISNTSKRTHLLLKQFEENVDYHHFLNN